MPDQRRPIDPFEEHLRPRLEDALDAVSGPHASWAASPARARIEAPSQHRAVVPWGRLVAMAAVLVLAGLGLNALMDRGARPAYTQGPAATQGETQAWPSLPPTAAASGEETPAPSASAPASLGPCASGQTPDPSVCVYGTPNGPELPAGGITKEMAIDIALSGRSPDLTGAFAEFDADRGRWVWRVGWGYSAGPSAGEWCWAVVDYTDGRVLEGGCGSA